MAKKSKKPFGQVLREKRVEKKYSLRKFAQLVGISPTYLSQVEQSNVDLAREFTNMILAQRGFQASARVITTSDEVLSELLNIKR